MCLAIVAILGAAGLLVVFHAQVDALLKWVDLLAPKPGLSGVALLVLSPAAFLLVAAIVHWVVHGIRKPRDPAQCS